MKKTINMKKKLRKALNEIRKNIEETLGNKLNKKEFDYLYFQIDEIIAVYQWFSEEGMLTFNSRRPVPKPISKEQK